MQRTAGLFRCCSFMLERIDYLLVKEGVRRSELKRIRLRPVVYGFSLVSLAIGATLATMIVVNIVV